MTREDLRWGMRLGARAALFFSIAAIVPIGIGVLAMPSTWTQRVIAFSILIGLYWIGGLLAGTLIGLARPWLDVYLGYLGTGILLSMLLVFGVRTLLYPTVEYWSSYDVVATAIGAIGYGAFISTGVWFIKKRRDRETP